MESAFIVSDFQVKVQQARHGSSAVFAEHSRRRDIAQLLCIYFDSFGGLYVTGEFEVWHFHLAMYRFGTRERW